MTDLVLKKRKFLRQIYASIFQGSINVYNPRITLQINHDNPRNIGLRALFEHLIGQIKFGCKDYPQNCLEIFRMFVMKGKSLFYIQKKPVVKLSVFKARKSLQTES